MSGLIYFAIFLAMFLRQARLCRPVYGKFFGTICTVLPNALAGCKCVNNWLQWKGTHPDWCDDSSSSHTRKWLRWQSSSAFQHHRAVMALLWGGTVVIWLSIIEWRQKFKCILCAFWANILLSFFLTIWMLSYYGGRLKNAYVWRVDRSSVGWQTAILWSSARFDAFTPEIWICGDTQKREKRRSAEKLKLWKKENEKNII